MNETENKKSLPEWMENNLEVLWFICVGFAFIYTLFRYKNPSGITYPLSIFALYMTAYLVMKRVNMVVKKSFYFYMIISVLLGISTFRTGNGFIHFFNNTAIIIISCICVINQRYSDTGWNIGKYIASIFLYLCYSIFYIGYSFVAGFKFIKKIQQKKYKIFLLVIGGVLISIPILTILIALLSKADAVFGSLVDNLLSSFLQPFTMISVIFKFFTTALAIFALICGAGIKNIKEETKDSRNGEPILMITCMGLVGLIYLLFSGIQILYLFMGKGTLPDSITYSEYAREGFFQLVFVVLLNLIMVLLCLKYFKKSNILNIILTIISICTYVMITSAAFRMLLYINEYHLTTLRVMVLWFLALVSILMIGVIAVIYHNKFPLFHYCTVVVAVFYLGYGWMRPDYIIAQYNVKHKEVLERKDIDYLTNYLSIDALPALMEISDDKFDYEYQWEIKDREDYLKDKIYGHENMSWRTYNLSYSQALKYK